ncbi:MAG: hypothetical protein ACO293_04925 [Nitrosopumilaceae archaeon]
MNKILIVLFSIIFIVSIQQALALPEIDDEVIVGFDSEAKAIPEWVKTTMEFYLDGQISEREILDAFNWLFENNIMHLSEEAALEVQQMRNQINDLKQELEETKANSNLLEARKGANESSSSDESGEYWFAGLKPGYYERSSGERIMQPEFGSGLGEAEVVVRGWDFEQKESTNFQDSKVIQRFVIELYAESVSLSDDIVWHPLKEGDVLVTFEDDEPDRPIIVGRIFDDSTQSSQVQPSQTKVLVMASSFDFEQSSEIVREVLRKGGTYSAWEEGIASFPPETTDSVVDDLQGIVVLCNNAIDKETQQIDAELQIISQWLKVIEEKQNDVSFDTAGRTAESQYNQSDLDFITRNLSSIDQKIKALSTGTQVLEQKLQSMGDDAQLANIDLQNSLQKQQQTLQTLSSVSKAAHDTAMSIIQKIG